MEGDDGISTAGSSSHETLTVGSSPDDDIGFQEPAEVDVEVELALELEPELPSSSSAAPLSSSSAETDVVLTDDLKHKIIRQVEFYFSDENLPTDKFLMKYMKKDKEGFVPVAVIASFRKMKKLVENKSLVVAALRESSELILSSDGKKVRRIRPLPITEVKDAKESTVFVENLPEDCSKENLQRIFGDVGNVRCICIRDPHSDSTKFCKAETSISGKIYALVEYETVKEAEKAVSTLNDEKSWRNGMRVELLLKRMAKFGPAKKGWIRAAASEKNGNVPASHLAGNDQNVKSLAHHSETPDHEEANHTTNEKVVGRNRRNRSRGRGQFKGQNQPNTNGHGHVSAPTVSRNEGPSKPPPGPKMPDGTRGFAMGRGQPPPSDYNHEVREVSV